MSCDEDDTVNKPSCTRSLQIVTSSISATIIQQAPGGANLPFHGSSCAGSYSAVLRCLGGLWHFAPGETALPKCSSKRRASEWGTNDDVVKLDKVKHHCIISQVLMSARMEASKIKQQCGMLRRAESSREMMSGANWASLEFALEDLKERDATTLHLESEESSWLNTQALPSVPFPQSSTHSSNPSSNPSSSMEREGSGDYCSQVESASYSTTSSSDQNGSGFTDGVDDSSLSILRDGNVRAILKKVKVNEAVLNHAIETLGGGEKGLKSLMGYIIMWVKEQKGCKSAASPAESSLDQSQQQQQFSMPFDFASSVAAAAASTGSYGAVTSAQSLTPAGPVIEPMLHQRNDRFHPFGRLAEVPMSANSTLGGAQEMHHLHQFKLADSTGTPGGAQQELHHLHRFKSRRLMMGEDASEAIYHQPTTTFMGIGGSLPMTTAAMMPGQQYPFPKPEMGGISGPVLSMGPMMPQMKCEDGGMQQQLYCNMQAGLGLTNGGGNLVDNSPAATTRAARRNRMARQRQSMSHHARISSHANATAMSGSGCGGSSQAGLQEMGGTRKTGSSQVGTQIAGGVNVERKGRNVESLTFLLQKELRNSDVGNLGRIVLPKKESEEHLPLLAMRGGINLQVEDFDSVIRWNFRYSVTLPPKEVRSSPLIVSADSLFWPNNKSRMYLLENTGEFVKFHHLTEGDLLILYKDRHGKFIIRGKKQVTLHGTGTQVKDSATKVEKIFPEEGTMQKVEGFPDRLHGGGAPSESIVKELPKVGDADPFLKDIMNNMGTPFGSECLLQPLERFPSLNLDFPLDEILAAIPKSPKSPKPEPAG